MLIGLAAIAQSGKDTVADLICARHTLCRVAFADEVRAVALRLDPYIADHPGAGALRLSMLVHVAGWDSAKKHPEVRRTLQQIGETARETFGEDVWIRIAARTVDAAAAQGYGAIVTDVRHENEAGWVRSRGGVVIHVRRDGAGLDVHGDHVSEAGIEVDVADFEIDNNGTMEDLAERVREVCEAIPELAAHKLTEATG